MLSDYVRERIAKLARKAHGHGLRQPPEPCPPPATPGRDLPAGEVVENKLGRHLQIERPLDDVWPSGQAVIDAWHGRRTTGADDPNAGDARSERAAFGRYFPREVVLLDLETCGLAGSMVFLTGLLHRGPAGLTLTQLFARDYSEEPATLLRLWEILAGKKVLVTFNGKSFDWPMIRDRTTYHRFEREFLNDVEVLESLQAERVHFDLLHHARRRYSASLPDCRLVTLEQHVCRRRRVGDIPGSEIPAAYHEFVRSGDATSTLR